MRVDEGRTSCTLLAIKTKARAVVEREKSLFSDPGSDLYLGREEKENVRR